ncbi:MAG TPA: exodeoxyribonuclease III [Bacteroidia bacterium]
MERKIITYNINGIRAALRKELITWLKATAPDILCLQEIKATQEQFDSKHFEEIGYTYTYWYSAQKKGYSGVAILSKVKPDKVVYGCGIKEYDDEARIIRADFGDVSIISAYHPSGTSGDVRQAFKMKWLDAFLNFITDLKKERPKLIVSGDINICHKAIDIHNPKANAKTSGFLPEEREWFDRFVASGFVDAFREFNHEPHQYTWWSHWGNARAKNLGWRIDYNMVTENLKNNLKRSVILPDALHSDHCPVLLEIDF